MRMRNTILVFSIAGLLLLAFACAPKPTVLPAVTSTPADQQTGATSEVTQTSTVPTFTPLPSTRTAAAQPSKTPRTVYHPSEARIGITGVDNVVSVVLSGDLAARRALMRLLTSPCTTAQGSGGPPKCAANEAEGTLVEVFPIMGEEGEFARVDTIDAFINFSVVGLYAIYLVPPYAYNELYWPAGQYGLLFIGNEVHQSITLLVQDSAIVRLNLSRLSPAEELAASKGIVLLPPPD